MLSEITLAVQGISTGYKIAKGFGELKTEYEVKSATSELLDAIIGVQNNLVSIQSSYRSLLDSKNEIEKELVDLKQWETTKLNHILKQITPGVFVYIMKEPGESPDNQYWLCANCFNTANQQSIYQNRIQGNVRWHIYYCPLCKNEIAIDNANYIELDIGGVTNNIYKVKRI